MSDPSPIPASIEEASILRAQRQLRVLEELTQIGMNLVRALEIQSEAEPRAEKPPAPAPRDQADTFQRLARAIRLTLALEARFDADLRALIAGEVTAAETRRAEAARRSEEARKKTREAGEERVRDCVEHVICTDIEPGDARMNCFEAMEERFDEDELYKNFGEAPLRETVERLCVDLGLSPDWSQWTGEGWALPPMACRPAHSIFNKSSRIPILPGIGAEPPPLE